MDQGTLHTPTVVVESDLYGNISVFVFQITSRGYHNSLQRMWDTYWEAETSAQSSRLSGLAQLKKGVDRLEPESDKKKYVLVCVVLLVLFLYYSRSADRPCTCLSQLFFVFAFMS